MPMPIFNCSALQPVSNFVCSIVHIPLSLRRSNIKLQSQWRCRQHTLSLSKVPRSIVCSMSLQWCDVSSALSSSWHLIPLIDKYNTLRPAMCSTNSVGKIPITTWFDHTVVIQPYKLLCGWIGMSPIHWFTKYSTINRRPSGRKWKVQEPIGASNIPTNLKHVFV